MKIKPWLDEPSVEYEREEIYPCEKVSKKLSWGILCLVRKNPGFAWLLAAIYALVALAFLAAINGGPGRLVEQGTGRGVIGFLDTVAGGAPLLLAIVLTGALFGYTDITPGPLAVKRRVRWPLFLLRFLVALAQTAVHLGLVGVFVWFALKWAPEPIYAWLLGVPATAGIGFVAGTTLFAVVLFAVHRIFGWRADRAANEVFAGQGIADYKNFVRMRLNANGLTLFPIGVDEVCEQWDYSKTIHGPKFGPRGGKGPALRLIDEAVQIPPPI